MKLSKNTIIMIVTVLVLIVVGRAVYAYNTPIARAERGLKLANNYLQEAKYQEAILAFNKVIELNPKDMSARLDLSKAYVATKAFPQAEVVLKEVIQMDSKNIDAREDLFRVYINEGNLDSANAILQDILRIDPNKDVKQLNSDLNTAKVISESKASYDQGIQQITDKEYIEAMASLQKVTNEDTERYADAQAKIDICKESYKHDVSNAYFSLLSKRINEFGILTGDSSIANNTSRGVALAKTIDFDNSNIPELYIIYKDGSSSEYTEELWGYKDGAAVRIAKEERYAQGLISDLSIRIVKSGGKTYIEYTSQYSTGTGEPPYSNIASDTQDVWTVSDYKYIKVAGMIREYKSDPLGVKPDMTIYSVTQGNDLKNVAQMEYDYLSKKYSDETIMSVVAGNAGSSIFDFEISKSATQINVLLDEFKNNILK